MLLLEPLFLLLLEMAGRLVLWRRLQHQALGKCPAGSTEQGRSWRCRRREQLLVVGAGNGGHQLLRHPCRS